MTIMSLDISTTSTGVAIFVEEELILVEAIVPGGNVYTRIEKIAERIDQLYRDYLPDIIVAEEPEPAFVKNNINVYRKLTIAHGAIAIVLNHYKKEMILCSSSHWRKNVGIKTGRGITRAMLKPQDIKMAKTLFPDYVQNIKDNDDKADAILIGWSYIVEHNKEYNWE